MSQPVRIIPLGGMGEVGRNLTAIEVDGRLLVIDCGLMFPESDMLGVDLVVPNFTYLADNVDRVMGYLITHGHEDHIGALPYVLPHVPAPIFATRLTRGLIEVKLKEHGLLSSAELQTIVPGEPFDVGGTLVEPFRVSHSIPDAVGFAINTPHGLIVHTGEFKFDLTPVDGQLTDLHRLAEYGRRGVLVLLSDSTNAEKSGYTPSEATVREALERVFERAPGRIVVATFASNISRVQEVINVAARHGRKVGLVGRSMEQNTAMARSLGYLRAEDDQIVSVAELDKLPDEEVVICCTGTQGEPTSALVRMANDTHRSVKLRIGDLVVLSATPIPGNEELVHRTLNQLFRRGVDVVYHTLTPVHVSGHASREEQKLMLRLVAPRFFVPMGGEYRMLVLHARLATDLGMEPGDVLVAENGQVVEVDAGSISVVGEVAGGYVYVDGLGVGDIGQVVLRDRHHLARDGFVVVVAAVDAQTRALASEPEILTRGFVYLPAAADLIEDLRAKVGDIVEDVHGSHDLLTNRLRDDLGQAIYDATKRRPMVIPLVVEV
jgi:ribonuclease J